MSATWPMVFAALAGGLIAGAMLPAGKQPAKVNLPASSTITTADAGGAQRAGTKAADAKDAPAAKIPRLQSEDKQDKMTASACREETWPYYSHTCLDDAASKDAPVQVIKTRRSDPAVAMNLDGTEKAQAAASNPAPRTETRQEPKSPSQRRPSGNAEARADAEPDDRASERKQAEPAQNTRPRYRTRQAELPDDRYEQSPRVIIQRDGRRIYVYPNVRADRWVAPRPWRDW